MEIPFTWSCIWFQTNFHKLLLSITQLIDIFWRFQMEMKLLKWFIGKFTIASSVMFRLWNWHKPSLVILFASSGEAEQVWVRIVFLLHVCNISTKAKMGARCVLFFTVLCQLVDDIPGKGMTWRRNCQKVEFLSTCSCSCITSFDKMVPDLYASPALDTTVWWSSVKTKCFELNIVQSCRHGRSMVFWFYSVCIRPPERKAAQGRFLCFENSHTVMVHVVHTARQEEPVALVCFYSTHKEPVFIMHPNMSPYLVSFCGVLRCLSAEQTSPLYQA